MLRLPSGSHAPRGNPTHGAPRHSLPLLLPMLCVGTHSLALCASLFHFWFPCSAWEPPLGAPRRSRPLLVPMLRVGTFTWRSAPIPLPLMIPMLRLGTLHLAPRVHPCPFWFPCSAWEPSSRRSKPNPTPSGSHAPRGNPFTGALRLSLPLLLPMLCVGTQLLALCAAPDPSGSHASRGNPHLALRAHHCPF